MSEPPLLPVLRELIADGGPIPVSRFMALALGHPLHGYYRTRDPLGRGGDFTTAPEISQMFGELLGLWAAETWDRLGRPAPVRLLELGPGRGTLMADALRATRVLPAFGAALDLHLVETSPVLREQQRTALAGHPASWHDDLSAVPDGPVIVLANEFLDALPVRQFVRRNGHWHERVVGSGSDGALAFGLAALPEPRLRAEAADGAILEIGEAAAGLADALVRRLAQDGGAALFVDYGHDRTGFGDTLQAMRGHAFVHPLEGPGEADLTTHVDFAAFRRAAFRAGGVAHGPVSQEVFLHTLGLRQRAERLARGGTQDRAEAVAAAYRRLTDTAPTGMGALFKALALSAAGGPALPGFDPPG